MGNDASQNYVLDTKWTEEDVSQFTINLTQEQTQIIFGKEKSVNPQNLESLLEETVVLYLLNVNVKKAQNVKVEVVRAKLDEYKKKGEIRETLQPILKYLIENKMQQKKQAIEMVDYPSVIGTWMQQFKSTMDTL
mmetsp:Transcript_334/g.463  ORF Transcript_334/g.463 Transcript_334/m.463 type:complete len:135 (+) Transcript_334:74-478(+)|eukprot:CAMPEP_0197039118 /NCGR_PEP_ID=MMETSP1384-20130603/15972_1 /TAXON_ID=29189 /ORGANISM="Ammonia sp." /LENGTH=134 /DNA_ID=CAMNT_0042469669 /DNA_START=67 /DNA_END=471 /DNA_ORIENTATION=-